MLDLITLSNIPFIDELYRNKRVSRDLIDYKDDHGGYFLLKDEQQSALAVAVGDELHLVNLSKDVNYQGAKPYDAHQTCFFHSLASFELTVAL